MSMVMPVNQPSGYAFYFMYRLTGARAYSATEVDEGQTKYAESFRETKLRHAMTAGYFGIDFDETWLFCAHGRC